MNLSDLAIIASIIVGLASVPFVASTIYTDYEPIGTILLNMSDMDNIPAELTRSLTSEKFEQTYQTPFGKFTIRIEADTIYQELTRPDRKVIVEETPEETKWQLTKKEYTLTITRTGEKLTDKFASPEGYLEKTKEMGDITEIVRGDVADYEEAKEILQEELERMEKIKRDYMEIPGADNATSTVTSEKKVAINEFLPNPDETQDYNHDGNFTDAGDEFIELYNYEDSEIDVSGWKLKDGNGKTLIILEGTIMDSEGFVYFISGDKDGDYGSDWSGSWPTLKNSGSSELKLYDDEEKLVDQKSYSSSTEGKSWSRIPDGAGDFEEADPTLGTSNE